MDLISNKVPSDFLKYNIKNYNFGKTIGKGMFGKVKEAIHIPTGEKVLYESNLGCNKDLK